MAYGIEAFTSNGFTLFRTEDRLEGYYLAAELGALDGYAMSDVQPYDLIFQYISYNASGTTTTRSIKFGDFNYSSNVFTSKTRVYADTSNSGINVFAQGRDTIKFRPVRYRTTTSGDYGLALYNSSQQKTWDSRQIGNKWLEPQVVTSAGSANGNATDSNPVLSSAGWVCMNGTGDFSVSGGSYIRGITSQYNYNPSGTYTYPNGIYYITWKSNASVTVPGGLGNPSDILAGAQV